MPDDTTGPISSNIQYQNNFNLVIRGVNTDTMLYYLSEAFNVDFFNDYCSLGRG